jgi:pimeloyl-ACP methyl ester carboxylesterase
VSTAALAQIEGVEHKYADLPDFRVHYAEGGDASGDPVLLLHGWPQHWAEWTEVMPALAEAGYRLIAPDLRGFGWSGTPGHGYDSETHAADQIALLDELGIERAHVLGHDWGCWTTFLIGLGHPDRVRNLIACNAPHPWVRPRPGLLVESWRIWYVWANALLGGPAVVQRTARRILTHGNVRDPFTSEELASFTGQFRDPERARAARDLYRYYLRSLRELSSNKYGDKRLDAPTLLLFGAADHWVTSKYLSHDEDYREHAPQMTVELVPDSGHFIVNEKPQLVIERALSHFSA